MKNFFFAFLLVFGFGLLGCQVRPKLASVHSGKVEKEINSPEDALRLRLLHERPAASISPSEPASK